MTACTVGTVHIKATSYDPFQVVVLYATVVTLMLQKVHYTIDIVVGAMAGILI